MRRPRRLVRLAALTWTESGLFRFLARGVKIDMLRPRPPCRARRAALHAGGADRVIKIAVGRRIARDDRRPARVGEHRYALPDLRLHLHLAKAICHASQCSNGCLIAHSEACFQIPGAFSAPFAFSVMLVLKT